MSAGATQEHWMHSVPKRAGVKETRINLTFRTVVHKQKQKPKQKKSKT